MLLNMLISSVFFFFFLVTRVLLSEGSLLCNFSVPQFFSFICYDMPTLREIEYSMAISVIPVKQY